MEQVSTKNKEIKCGEIKDKILIDLVVPVYHNKETLMRLFASVVTQTVKDNINIILVQDADEEDYLELIKMFDKMLKVELVKMKQNSGPGACRRIGMQYGKSKYIMFMDADDTFQNPFAAQELLQTIEENELDAVNSIFLEELPNHRFASHDNDDWVWVFGKIYRRSYLEENQIYFNDSRANEDTGFNTIVYEHGRVGFLPDNTYIWWHKPDSITRVDGGIYRFTGIEGWLYNMSWAVENLVRLSLEEERIRQRVAIVICHIYCWYLEFEFDKDPRVDVNKFLEWVEKFILETYNNHIPTNEQLCEAYKNKSQDKILTKKIPTITLKDFIKMVGGESAKE